MTESLNADHPKAVDAALHIAVQEGQSSNLLYFITYLSSLGLLTTATGILIWQVAY